MKLYKDLNIELNHREMVCFVGAGGKTTTMFQLARELKELGKRVLITTTTAIYYPGKEDCDFAAIKQSHELKNLIAQKGTITVIGSECALEHKLRGYEGDILNQLFEEGPFDFILVEGDGAKMKPIKAPAAHEPVIPSFSTCTVGVVGLDAIGLAATDENVHRIKEFCILTGSSEGSIITEQMVVQLIINPMGLFKSTPIQSRKYALLNKVQDGKLCKSAELIAEEVIKDQSTIQGVIAASVKENNLYRQWRR